MGSNMVTDIHTRAGTVGGFLFAIFMQIHSADILKTALLAAVAAVVSFLVSFGLKYLVRWIKKWFS